VVQRACKAQPARACDCRSQILGRVAPDHEVLHRTDWALHPGPRKDAPLRVALFYRPLSADTLVISPVLKRSGTMTVVCNVRRF
jgi:hypothetical protein